MVYNVYFNCMSSGHYKIVPHYQSEHSTFDVSPSELEFQVVADTVQLDTAFTVNGFAVIGEEERVCMLKVMR